MMGNGRLCAMKTPASPFVLILALGAWSTSSPVRAQSLFVEGSVFGGIERRVTQEVETTITPSSQGATSIPVPDINGTIVGGTFTIGTWVAPRVTLRLETSWPGEVEDRVERTQTIPGAGPVPVLTSSIERQSRDRARTFAALVGYHTARRRGVQLGYVGGAAFVWRTLRQREVTNSATVTGGGVVLGPGGVIIPQPVIVIPIERVFDSTTNIYGVSAAVGMDADIAIGSRFSAVPYIRVIGMNGGVSVRPGVGFRATW